MNKRILLLFILCLSISLLGCKKSGLTTSFDVSDTENFTIPPNAAPISLLPSLFTPPFATSSWQGTYSNNNTDKNHIQKCTLKSLSLTITSPQGKTFGFVQSIKIYIQSPNLPDVEVAHIDNNPTTAGSTINLTPDDIDLSAYAKSDSFTLRVETTTQQNNPDNVDVQSNMTLHIVANVL